MAMVGSVLLVVGSIVIFVAWIIVLMLAFGRSVLWGLGLLFFPFAILIYVIMYWEESKIVVLIFLVGFSIQVLAFIPLFLSGA